MLFSDLAYLYKLFFVIFFLGNDLIAQKNELYSAKNTSPNDPLPNIPWIHI